MYNKISYKQSELTDYVSKRLIDDGYIDAKINQKLSDDQLYSAMDKLEMEFKSVLKQNRVNMLSSFVIQKLKNISNI